MSIEIAGTTCSSLTIGGNGGVFGGGIASDKGGGFGVVDIGGCGGCGGCGSGDGCLGDNMTFGEGIGKDVEFDSAVDAITGSTDVVGVE